MDNKRIRNISFSTQNMEEFNRKCDNQNKLLPIYLDHIQNGRELTEEMFVNIENFDSSSKMKIIVEYNKCIKIFANIFN
jgi:hypothetical protein